ncbi:MAG TPA: SurA N-terminal domain-containing protein [Myxococcota bacterium]|nr:SurA N-terminal domain-containing protein [Myxococcota bacterium]
MKSLAALLLAVGSCAPGVFLCASAARGGEVVEGVAAIVGDEVVLLSEVREAWHAYVNRVRARGEQVSQEDLLQLRTTALQTLIDEKLVLQVAKKQNLSASEEEIDESISGIAQDEGMTVDAIYAAAAAQGLDKKTYREQLGRQITRMKIVQGAVQGKVRVSDEEVRKLYDERYGHAKPGERIRVLHILIPVPADANEAKRAEARTVTEQLREKAVKSGDFAGLARKYSGAPTAPQGGLTVFRAADAPPEIKNAISGLAPGEISAVVENAHGENLFQFLDKFDPADVPYEKVADKLRGELMEQQTMPAFEKWIAEVRKSRYVEVVAPELR